MVAGNEIGALHVSSSSSEITRLRDSIMQCCDSIANVLTTTFDQVSTFAQSVWTAIKRVDLFVDVIVRNLILLEKHVTDLARAIDSGIHSFALTDIIPFLYTIEDFLVQQMMSNAFFARTFGWLVKGIISFIQHLRGSVVVYSE